MFRDDLPQALFLGGSWNLAGIADRPPQLAAATSGSFPTDPPTRYPAM
jgi:hypothetical protein